VHVTTTSVVDATGAGDAVAAVIVAAHARQADPPLREVTSLAVRVAANVVRSHGALAGLPGADEARALLAAAVGPE
jgi:sugar/nucleoside kinase (ribokinase family)